MSDPDDIRADLEPGVDESLVALASRLLASRPVPRAGFRGELGRRLAARRRPRLSHTRLRALIATYAAAGIVLLCLGSVSAAGVGPLG